MASLDDFVRSFGMSGYLITEELKKIEQQYDIELGHLPKPRASSVEYYPQFEQAVRTEAAEASEHYEVIYCLEQSIRKLITETLEDAVGADWWNSGKVPPDVQQEVNKRLKTEKESGMTQRSTDLIDYTTFGELSVIISANWDFFKTVLTEQRAVARVLRDLNLLRNPVAHCSPMAADEVERLRLSVKDWFRLMG
jgi:Swt1-like HEPN